MQEYMGMSSGTNASANGYGGCKFDYTVTTDTSRTADTGTYTTTYTSDVTWSDGDLYAWACDTGNSDTTTWHVAEMPELSIRDFDAHVEPATEVEITRVTYDRHDLRIYLDDQHRVLWKVWVEQGQYDDEAQQSIEQLLNQEGERFRRWFYVDRHEQPETAREFARETKRRFEEAAVLRQQRQEEHDRLEAERKAKTEKAEEVAQQLLASIIGEEQLKVYNETGRLMVKGEKADYILQKGGLVKMVEKDKIVDLCIHLRDKMSMPPTDNVVALKLMVEAEEDEFLKTANRHEVEDRPAVLPLAACG
jgi:hypothetical protein